MSADFEYSGPLPAFSATSGPRNAKIALVAETWGQQEELTKQPLIGSSGQELNRMLSEAGLQRSHCFATNVFALRPTANNLELLCDSKKAVGGKLYTLPQIKQGKYVEPRFLPEVNRLAEELRTIDPNLVIALGGVATWALLQNPRIGTIRGTTAESVLVPGLKVLPTYHPSAVLRNWPLRTIVLADLLKAAREAEFPEIRRPQRFILVRPTLAEMWEWWEEHGRNAPWIAIDIETTKGQIKNIGFATHRQHAINIPFIVKEKFSYWPTLEEEHHAWSFVKMACESDPPKIGQNFLYDLQFIWRMGIRVKNYREDTMLLHHSLYPELQKGLGFLGSIYSNEPAWKLMRKNTDMMKRDDE